MGKEILTFGNIAIEKNISYRHKNPILEEGKEGREVDIEKVLVSNKISFDEKNSKYFIGYLYNVNKDKPLNIMLPKTSAYVKRYVGQTKWMYFWIADDDSLEKYSTIWDKVSADIKIEFDSEPVYYKNYLKTKIKFHRDEVTDFYDKEIPKFDSNHTYLAVISLDSALKKNDNYYSQVFLKECKCISKKVVRDIHDNLSDFSYSSDDSRDE